MPCGYSEPHLDGLLRACSLSPSRNKGLLFGFGSYATVRPSHQMLRFGHLSPHSTGRLPGPPCKTLADPLGSSRSLAGR